MKFKINNIRKFVKFTIMWQLNNHLNNKLIQKEIIKKIIKYFKMN